MKAHIVLTSDILGEQIETYTPEAFDADRVRQVFNEKKEQIKQESGEEVVQQFDGLMKDLQYLVEMKKLENKTEADRAATKKGGKLELSYAVPLSGLIMGCFFRLENVLKTVLELWVPKEPKPEQIPFRENNNTTPPQPDPSPEKKPSNEQSKLHRPEAKVRATKSSFGTITPSTMAKNSRAPAVRRNTLIGSKR